MKPPQNILLIDKPSGITSFDVIRQLRRKLGIKKIGHAGTLDPLASGLLIIAMGKATKELAHYMNLQKEYEVIIEFGGTSTTYDADGIITETKQEQPMITREKFEQILQYFIGTIQQKPPAFSAIRVKGQRAYDLARKGKPVCLAPRVVTIHAIDIVEWNWPCVRLKVHCGKGTYIRSLAHDLGQALGCGGYVKELRRIAIGNFRIEEAIKIH